MNATDVSGLTERIAITQLTRSRTSSDVSLERRQRKPEMLLPTCRRWVAVATRRQMVHRRTAEN